jgi:hypothetical protein
MVSVHRYVHAGRHEWPVQRRVVQLRVAIRWVQHVRRLLDPKIVRVVHAGHRVRVVREYGRVPGR